MTGHALRWRETSGGKRLALRALHALNKRRLALCLIAAVLMAALSTLSMYSRISLYGIGPERPSAGDAVLWLFMGNALGFSPEWGAVWCLVLVAGAVDVRSLAGSGPGACYVVASGGRGAFWRSLCLVAGLTSALVIAFWREASPPWRFPWEARLPSRRRALTQYRWGMSRAPPRRATSAFFWGCCLRAPRPSRWLALLSLCAPADPRRWAPA